MNKEKKINLENEESNGKSNKNKDFPSDYEKLILLAKMHNTEIIKVIIESLKDIVTKYTLTFKNPKMDEETREIKEDSGGLSISCFEKETNNFFKIRVFYNEFKPYYVSPIDGRDQVDFTVDSRTIANKVKNKKKKPIPIQLKIKKEDPDSLELLFNDKDNNSTRHCTVKKLENKANNYTIKRPDQICEILIKPDQFYEYIKNISNSSDEILFEYVDTKLIKPRLKLIAIGEFGDHDSYILNTETKDFRVIKTMDNEEIVYSGKYKVDSLQMFQKCSNSFDRIRFLLLKNGPLIIKHEKDNYGYILSAIPSIEGEMNIVNSDGTLIPSLDDKIGNKKSLEIDDDDLENLSDVDSNEDDEDEDEDLDDLENMST